MRLKDVINSLFVNKLVLFQSRSIASVQINQNNIFMADSELEHFKSENEHLKKEIEHLKYQMQYNSYKAMFSSSPDIIIQLDTSNKIQVIHIPDIEIDRLDTLRGKDIFDVTPVHTHQKMDIALKEVFQEGKVLQYYSEGETLGMYRYYDNYLSPIKDDAGSIVSVYFRSREITTQILAEKILLDSERKLKTVYENSIQILTILDLDRKFTWFNRNALVRSPAVLGEELKIGVAAEMYIEKSQRALFIENFNKAAAGEIVTYLRQVNLKPEIIFIEYTLSPIKEENEVVGVALTGMNVTKHKEYEDYLKRVNLELVQQNERLNQYSYIISHNLRGPIATLMGLVGIFDQCKDDSKQINELIGLIKKSSTNLDTIIVDLNAVLSSDINEENTFTEINVKEECSGIAFLLSSQVEKSNAQFIYNLQCESVYSIRSYIHSILYNLISNAIKYKSLHLNPIIEISSYIEDEMVCIECKDNGIGIDMPRFGDKLFGFYKRFHSHVEGKGLGLHLVKKQVELLHGRVEVKSAVGEGSTFSIFLPK